MGIEKKDGQYSFKVKPADEGKIFGNYTCQYVTATEALQNMGITDLRNGPSYKNAQLEIARGGRLLKIWQWNKVLEKNGLEQLSVSDVIYGKLEPSDFSHLHMDNETVSKKTSGTVMAKAIADLYFEIASQIIE